MPLPRDLAPRRRDRRKAKRLPYGGGAKPTEHYTVPTRQAKPPRTPRPTARDYGRAGLPGISGRDYGRAGIQKQPRPFSAKQPLGPKGAVPPKRRPLTRSESAYIQEGLLHPRRRIPGYVPRAPHPDTTARRKEAIRGFLTTSNELENQLMQVARGDRAHPDRGLVDYLGPQAGRRTLAFYKQGIENGLIKHAPPGYLHRYGPKTFNEAVSRAQIQTAGRQEFKHAPRTSVGNQLLENVGGALAKQFVGSAKEVGQNPAPLVPSKKRVGAGATVAATYVPGEAAIGAGLGAAVAATRIPVTAARAARLAREVPGVAGARALTRIKGLRGAPKAVARGVVESPARAQRNARVLKALGSRPGAAVAADLLRQGARSRPFRAAGAAGALGYAAQSSAQQGKIAPLEFAKAQASNAWNHPGQTGKRTLYFAPGVLAGLTTLGVNVGKSAVTLDPRFAQQAAKSLITSQEEFLGYLSADPKKQKALAEKYGFGPFLVAGLAARGRRYKTGKAKGMPGLRGLRAEMKMSRLTARTKTALQGAYRGRAARAVHYLEREWKKHGLNTPEQQWASVLLATGEFASKNPRLLRKQLQRELKRQYKRGHTTSEFATRRAAIDYVLGGLRHDPNFVSTAKLDHGAAAYARAQQINRISEAYFPHESRTLAERQGTAMGLLSPRREQEVAAARLRDVQAQVDKLTPKIRLRKTRLKGAEERLAEAKRADNATDAVAARDDINQLEKEIGRLEARNEANKRELEMLRKQPPPEPSAGGGGPSSPPPQPEGPMPQPKKVEPKQPELTEADPLADLSKLSDEELQKLHRTTSEIGDKYGTFAGRMLTDAEQAAVKGQGVEGLRQAARDKIAAVLEGRRKGRQNDPFAQADKVAEGNAAKAEKAQARVGKIEAALRKREAEWNQLNEDLGKGSPHDYNPKKPETWIGSFEHFSKLEDEIDGLTAALEQARGAQLWDNMAGRIRTEDAGKKAEAEVAGKGLLEKTTKPPKIESASEETLIQMAAAGDKKAEAEINRRLYGEGGRFQPRYFGYSPKGKGKYYGVWDAEKNDWAIARGEIGGQGLSKGKAEAEAKRMNDEITGAAEDVAKAVQQAKAEAAPKPKLTPVKGKKGIYTTEIGGRKYRITKKDERGLGELSEYAVWHVRDITDSSRGKVIADSTTHLRTRKEAVAYAEEHARSYKPAEKPKGLPPIKGGARLPGERLQPGEPSARMRELERKMAKRRGEIAERRATQEELRRNPPKRQAKVVGRRNAPPAYGRSRIPRSRERVVQKQVANIENELSKLQGARDQLNDLAENLAQRAAKHPTDAAWAAYEKAVRERRQAQGYPIPAYVRDVFAPEQGLMSGAAQGGLRGSGLNIFRNRGRARGTGKTTLAARSVVEQSIIRRAQGGAVRETLDTVSRDWRLDLSKAAWEPVRQAIYDYVAAHPEFKLNERYPFAFTADQVRVLGELRDAKGNLLLPKEVFQPVQMAKARKLAAGQEVDLTAISDVLRTPGDKVWRLGEAEKGALYEIMPRNALEELRFSTHNPTTRWGKTMDIARGTARAQAALVLSSSLAWVPMQVIAEGFPLVLDVASPNPKTLFGARDITRAIRTYREMSSYRRSVIDAYAGGVLGWGLTPRQMERLGYFSAEDALVAHRSLGSKVLDNTIFGLQKLDAKKGMAFRRIMAVNRAEKIAQSMLKNQKGAWDDMGQALEGMAKLKDQSQAARLKYMTDHPELMRRVDEHVRDMLGDWVTLTRNEVLPASFVFFYPMVRYTTRFVFHSFPKRHPLKAYITYMLGQANSQEAIKLLGGFDPEFITPLMQGILYNGKGEPRPVDISRASPGGNALIESAATGFDWSAIRIFQPLVGYLASAGAGIDPYYGNLLVPQFSTVTDRGKLIQIDKQGNAFSDLLTAQRGEMVAGSILRLPPVVRNLEQLLGPENPNLIGLPFTQGQKFPRQTPTGAFYKSVQATGKRKFLHSALPPFVPTQSFSQLRKLNEYRHLTQQIQVGNAQDINKKIASQAQLLAEGQITTKQFNDFVKRWAKAGIKGSLASGRKSQLELEALKAQGRRR